MLGVAGAPRAPCASASWKTISIRFSQLAEAGVKWSLKAAFELGQPIIVCFVVRVFADHAWTDVALFGTARATGHQDAGERV